MASGLVSGRLSSLMDGFGLERAEEALLCRLCRHRSAGSAKGRWGVVAAAGRAAHRGSRLHASSFRCASAACRLPRSERQTRPRAGRCRRPAVMGAVVARAVRRRSRMDQPAALRLARSSTAARRSQPSPVGRQAMSASRTLLGAQTQKSCFSRFGASGRSWLPSAARGQNRRPARARMPWAAVHEALGIGQVRACCSVKENLALASLQRWRWLLLARRAPRAPGRARSGAWRSRPPDRMEKQSGSFITAGDAPGRGCTAPPLKAARHRLSIESLDPKLGCNLHPRPAAAL